MKQLDREPFYEAGVTQRYLKAETKAIIGGSWNRVKQGLSGSSISRKIVYSYALVIGVSICGTAIGLIIGDTYQKQARQQLNIADKQQNLLQNLEKEVLELRSHPQRLTAVLGDSIWFNYETEKFLRDLHQIQTLTSQINEFSQNYPDQIGVSSLTLQKLAQDYQQTTQAYAGLVRSLWQSLDPANIQTANISKAQQHIIYTTTQGEAVQISIELERLAETLTKTNQAAQTQHHQAEQSLDQAETWRTQIIVASMLLSVVIATLLAHYTSRAIAQPLEKVTQVARRVVQESNFHLQIPITTHDEVASLTTSLNQLIEWVGKYTTELEQSRETLEQRVEERTQELTAALRELKQAQTQLIQSEKMSSLGQLVAGIAHEINNPVNFIHGNLSYTAQYTEDLLKLIQSYQTAYPEPSSEVKDSLTWIDLKFIQEDFPKILHSMQVGTERIREIVKSLRNFSRLDEADVKAVNLHEGIDSTLMILHNRLKVKSDRPAIEVYKDYGSLPPVECYVGQLNQVFMNILANAIDALEEAYLSRGDGELKIWIQTEAISDQTVRIRMADNGCGMSETVRSQIFDPFFTTKTVGKGTGLGLAISYQIIQERHHGQIVCHSQMNQGTEFIIKIPIRQTS